MSDYVTTTNRLMNDDEFIKEFLKSTQFVNAFEEYMIKQHPEYYGND
jgi:hypothetical protein